MRFSAHELADWELCGEVASVLTCVTPQVVYSGDVGTMTLESLKRNPKVVNEVDVYPGQEHRVAFEEAMKYGGKVIPVDRPDKFLDAPDTQRIIYWFTCLRSPSCGKIWRGKMSLWEKIKAIRASLVFEKFENHLKGRSEKPVLSAVRILFTLVSFLISCGEKIEFIHSSLLMKKHENLLEGPLKKPAVSTVKMLSSLGVSIAGVAILSGIYFGWRK